MTSTPVKCSTRARVVITSGEGISVTACPLSDDASSRHNVEVFSTGWARKAPFYGAEPSKVVSIEFINPDDEEYSFTWLELSKKPHAASSEFLGKIKNCIWKY